MGGNVIDHKKVWGSGFHAGKQAGVQEAGNTMRGNSRYWPSAKDHMLCWTPNTDRVALVPWPDREGRSDKYLYSGLACYTAVREMTFEQRKAHVFIEAMHLIARDGVKPEAVHLTLLGLAEYRDGCAEDMPYLYA